MARRKKNRRLTPVQMAKQGLWEQRKDMMTNHQPGEWSNYKLLTQYEYERLMAWINEPIGLSGSKISAKDFFEQYNQTHPQAYSDNEHAIQEAADYLAKEHAKKFSQNQQAGRKEQQQKKDKSEKRSEKTNTDQTPGKPKEEKKTNTPKKEEPQNKPEQKSEKRPAPVKYTADKKTVEQQNKAQAEQHKQMDVTIAQAKARVQNSSNVGTEKKTKTKTTVKKTTSKTEQPKTKLVDTAEDPFVTTRPIKIRQVRDIPDFMIKFVHDFLIANKVDPEKLSMGKQLIYFIAVKMDDLTWHSYEEYFSTPARAVINKMRLKNKDSAVDRYADETHKVNNRLAEIQQEIQMGLLLSSESFNDRVLGTSRSAAMINNKNDYLQYDFGHDGASDLMMQRLREIVKNDEQARRARDFSTDRFAHTTHSESD